MLNTEETSRIKDFYRKRKMIDDAEMLRVRKM